MIHKIEYLREPFLEGSLKDFHVNIDDYTILVNYDAQYEERYCAYTLNFTYRGFEDMNFSNEPKDIWKSIESLFNLIDWIKTDPDSYRQFIKDCKPWVSPKDVEAIINKVIK